MPVTHGQAETFPTDIAIGPTVRAFGFGFHQRPDGRLVLSAGIDSRVQHRLTLRSTRDARLWASRYRVNRGNVRLGLDPADAPPAARSRATVHRPHSGRHRAASAAPRRRRRRPRHAPARHAGSAGLRIGRCWSGLLDISPDGLPIIDRINGIVFVTGLGGHGLALGPVTGEITADLALDGATPRPIHPFRLARFREDRVELPDKMI